MKKTLTRATSIILAALLLGAVGCGSAGEKPKTSGSDAQESTVSESVTETEDTSRAKDNLPATDFKGKTFGILIKDEMSYEFDPENSSEIISDAVHKRNLSIENRFNCKLNYIHEPGAWASRETFQSLISNAVLTGDPVYDIVTGQSNILMPLAVQQMYNNVADAKYIDFDQPYWKSGYHENAMINGKLFTLCGDFALTTFSCSNVLFFNKKLFTDNGMEFPYETVKAGKWTLDEFLSTVTNKTADLDGDGVINENDLHGFASGGNQLSPFFVSTGLHLTKPDGDRRVPDFMSDATIDVFDKIHDYCRSKDFIRRDDLANGIEFKEGKFFMIGCTLNTVEVLRDMEVDFGILPYPKYDENQENYRTSVLRTYTVAAIPNSASNKENPEIILEALCCAGYNGITPLYYEKALNGKFFRDEESSEMLDIINATTYLEFADVFYSDLGAISDILVEYAFSSNSRVASFWERKQSAFKKNLENLYDNFED